MALLFVVVVEKYTRRQRAGSVPPPLPRMLLHGTDRQEINRHQNNDGIATESET